MFYTYILRSVSRPGAIYIGSTGDLRRRLAQHNAPSSRYYSKRHTPWEIESYLAFSTSQQAKDLESHLKSSSGKAFMKKRLISKQFLADLEKFRNNRI